MAEYYSIVPYCVCTCVCIPHLSPFICWWTFRLIPCLGYCKQWCNEHWGEASVSFKSPAGDTNMQMNESHGLREAMDMVGKDIWADLVDKIHPPEKPKEGTWLWHQMKWNQVKSLSCVQLFATPWTVAYQAPPMGYSRQEYWSGLPFPSPEDLPHPGIKPGSPAL